MFLFCSMQSAPPAPALDALAAQQMAALGELRDLAMNLARALAAQARAAIEPGAPEAPQVTAGDPVAMFARVARAVRQTIVLEMRIAQPDPQRDAERRRAEAAHASGRRKGELSDVAGAIIEADSSTGGRNHLLGLLDARIHIHAEREPDFADLPLGVLVARICRELGVRPDWSLWAETDWARDEAEAQVPGSPFSGPSAPPMSGRRPPSSALVPPAGLGPAP
jgi:hypothetical protein